MKKIIISLWFLVALLNCNNTITSFEENIKGKWINGSIHLDIGDERIVISNVIANQRINIIDRKFKIKKKQDKYFFHLTPKANSNSNSNSELIYFFDLKENSLLFASYKTAKGITSHIDEVGTFCRKDKVCETSSNFLEKHIIPNSYRGKILINYLNREIDNERVLAIPSSGILKTNINERIDIVAYQQLKYTYQNGTNIPMIIIKQLKKLSLNEQNKNDIYVCLLGFNQLDRALINEYCGETIHGNVLMLEVNTLGKLKESLF
jgi:c-di-AMP phosphodiesterase-like protein